MLKRGWSGTSTAGHGRHMVHPPFTLSINEMVFLCLTSDRESIGLACLDFIPVSRRHRLSVHSPGVAVDTGHFAEQQREINYFSYDMKSCLVISCTLTRVVASCMTKRQLSRETKTFSTAFDPVAFVGVVSCTACRSISCLQMHRAV